VPDRNDQRLFLALWPDSFVRLALQDLQTQLNLAQWGRLTPVDNLHLTLLFIGARPSDEVRLLLEQLDEIRFDPFRMTIDQVGFWPHNNIIWAGSSQVSTALCHLSQQASKIFANGNSGRQNFFPHVTLARKVRRRIQLDFEAIPWHIRSLHLVQSTQTSEGVKYTRLTRSKSGS